MRTRNLLCPLVAVAVLTACDRPSSTPEAFAPAMAADAARSLMEAPRAKRAANSTLAYEHHVTAEIEAAVIERRLREIRATCTPQGELRCTLLDVSSDTEGAVPSANLRMRLAPEGVGKLVSLAGQGGRLLRQSTHAEDLAEPIADTNRQLALLTTHRERLTEILKSRDLKVDQLITVSRELSTVQAEIDSFGTQRANLQRRVDTDLLNLQLTPPQQTYGRQQSPVTDALRDFGIDVARSVGNVVRFLAAILPWTIVFGLSLVAVRLLWRRWRNRRVET